jgi:Flp pilus assembly protein TadG
MIPIIPSFSVLLVSLRRRISGCAHDERGISAVEFALLLPLMVTLYLGGVEVSQGLTIDRKVTLAARTVADLAARVKEIKDSGAMSAILDASTAVMLPYSINDAKVTVSQVCIDANGQATISWSDSKNGTKRAKGSGVTLPTALNIPSSSLIWSEVSYNYKPVIGYVITGPMALTDQIYMRPRLSESVKYANEACA